jgi:DNA-binding CsgD family transcriptional regulator/5-methylcytosine-specific restriction endonuclease McrA
MSTRSQVEMLLAKGLNASEIARRLGLARSTVEYHVNRLRAVAPDTPTKALPEPIPPGEGRRSIDTRERVALLLSEGRSKGEIARVLGVSKSTVSYHARRLGAPVDSRGARRYDWRAVQRFYDDGHTVRECQAHFGFSLHSWHAAVKRKAITARPHAMPLDELLVSGVYRGRFNLKARLVSTGVKMNHCETCGIDAWLGRPLTLTLHHVNGDRNDHRLENLQLLCPNCHSQTDTFAGRNGRRSAV